jgi:O-methyltransferase
MHMLARLRVLEDNEPMMRPLLDLLRGARRTWRLTRRASLAQTWDEPWATHWIHEFIAGGHGSAYGLTAHDRAALVKAFDTNVREIPSGTSLLHHVALAQAILDVAPSVAGDVVECGAWKGASSASLSLVCRATKRRLLVCDSFEGLPGEEVQPHVAPHFGIYGYYKAGMFCGTLEEVQRNVTRFGAPESCTYVRGFFADSLKTLRDPIALAFLDVDLVSSTRECLQYIWPRLVEGSAVYTDDAGDLDVVRVFFDDGWWKATLGCASPGYVGSGCGLPLNPRASSLGYTRKLSHFDPRQWAKASHLFYPDGA